MTNLRGVIAAAGVFVVMIAVIWGFYWSMSLGGKPEVSGGRAIYRLRPGMRVLSWVFIVGGVTLLCYCASTSIAHSERTSVISIYLVIALVMITGGLFTLSAFMVVDEQGIHYFRWPNKETVIAWDDLSHYSMGSAGKGGDLMTFWSKFDEKIVVSVMAYDADDMLQSVFNHKHIGTEPKPNEKWFS